MKIVVLGAGYAGITAALRIARGARGAAHVTLINAEASFVERIRLHEAAAGAWPEPRSIASWLRGTDIALRIGRVRAVDLEAKTLELDSEPEAVSWDRLVLALGSQVDLRIPGAREYAHSLDARGAGALAEKLGMLRKGARVVVVGGGLTGIEAATELAETWPLLRVSLVTRGPVASGFSAKARACFARAFARLGIEVQEGVAVRRVAMDRLETAGAPVPFDACVWTPGFLGATLPRGLDLVTNERGQVVTLPALHAVGRPDVLVAGDLAACDAPVPIPMGCKSAGPGGAHVADNVLLELAGQPPRAFDYVAPAYCVSLGRKDGVLQLARADGSLEGAVIGGRAAAWIKELICKFTLLSFALERRGLLSYSFSRAGNVRELPAHATPATR